MTAGDWSVPETEVMDALAEGLDERNAVLAPVVSEPAHACSFRTYEMSHSAFPCDASRPGIVDRTVERARVGVETDRKLHLGKNK